MRDIGNDETEVLLAEIEKKIGREYKKAAEDIEAKLNDYWRRFQIKDDAWQRMVANGTKTKQQYQQWRTGQLMVGKRWEGMKETIANDLHNANTIAKGIVNGNLAEVYAANHNFTTFDIEKAAGVNTSFTLVDRDTVNRIIRDNPELLPPPSATLQKEFADFDAYKEGKAVELSEEKRKAFDKLIADNKDIRWQEGKIQSITLQSILQGESIPNMAKRIAQELGETNHKSTIRYARTAVTGAQNAGKEDAYRRAEAHGCKMKRVWRAVHDNRTRHEHRVLDGQIRGIDEPFEIDGYKIDFPADPKLAREAPYLYWNCRCYTRALIDGLEPQAVKYRPETIDGMTYDEWLNAKPKSRSITHQEEVAETMRRRTIRELYGGNGGGTGNIAAESPMQAKSFTFTPAKTIEEAEKYIGQYCDTTRFGAVGISYEGISLDVANEINKTIGRFCETFNTDKFGGIIAPQGNTKMGKAISNATAAYSDVRRSFLLNRKTLKTLASAEKAFADEGNAITDILLHPEKYDFSKASARLLRVVENSKESGRGTIPRTIGEALNHELGHSLERQITKHELWQTVVDNMPTYNRKLSGYACEDKSEYLAESFCSYMKGEDLIDPVLAKVFDSFRR